MKGEIKSTSFNRKLYKKNGDPIWVKINTSLARDDDNKPLYYLIHVEDITEKKKAQQKIKKQREELEYNRLKTRFFAKLSHELKTPLNLIFTSLHMLTENQKKLIENNPEILKINKYTDLIKQNSYRLLRQVNNVIDLTKMDTDSFEINLQNCNIVKILRKITQSTRDYVENNGRQLIFNTDIDKKITACDPLNIERIILNLISNAVKFTNKDDKITVSLTDKGDNILISVKDTGIGIKKEDQNLVFEQFRQVDESFTRKNEGSGIGLSIVKSLVELHNGSIRVESDFGKGSEFIIELPVYTVAEEKDFNITQFNDNLIDKISVEFSDIYGT